MLTKDEVIWAYRFLLGREPENDAVIESHRTIASQADLRRAFLESPEFISSSANKFPDIWVLAQVLQKQRWMWVNLSDRHVSLGCLLDAYEPTETALFSRMVQSGDTVIDIGANLGWYTLIASTIIGTEGRIISVEPRPETLERLQKTVEINELGDRVSVVGAALGETAGEGILAWAKNTSNPGGSHLTHDKIGGDVDGVNVPLLALDELGIDRCDVIKIDVEGAEYRVMKGGMRVLNEHRPIILSELHPAQLSYVSQASASDYIALMASAGYICRLATANGLGATLIDFPADVPSDVVNVIYVPTDHNQALERRLAC